MAYQGNPYAGGAPPPGQYPPPQQYPAQGGYGGGAYPPPSGYPPQQGQYPPPGGPGGYGGGGAYPPPGGPPGGGYYPPPGGPPQHQQPYGVGPQQAFGAPPPHQGYGAPPPQQHYPQQAPYGGPAAGPQVYLGVPIPAPAFSASGPPPPPPGFDVNGTVDRVYKSMKGFGTDEKALIAAVAPLDAFQADALRVAYRSQKGKDVIEHIEKETSGNLENVLVSCVWGPLMSDVVFLRKATKGAGTDENALNEILLCRTNAEIHLLKQAWQSTYGTQLERVIEDELSFKTKRMFIMALAGGRVEENIPPNPSQTQADVQTLLRAMKGAGTDEITVLGVLLNRNSAQLAAIAHEFRNASHGRTLSQALKSEFSGHMEDGLLYISRTAEEGPVARDAWLLENAMAGVGTKDNALIRRIIRPHWNQQHWYAVKQAYRAKYHKRGLVDRVKGETSGDYERALVAVIGADI